MPSYRAVSGVWARTMPPAAFTSRMPSVPSDAVPERITAIARSCAESASVLRKKSIGVYCVRSVGRGRRCSRPSTIPICTFGGMT